MTGKKLRPFLVLLVFFAAAFLTSCGGCPFGGKGEIKVGEIVVNQEFVDGDEIIHSGLILESDNDYLKTEATKLARSFAGENEALYSRLPPFADLSSKLPAPGDQGNQNSCTGWALAYAVKSFQESRENNWELSDKTLFSPSFLYNQLNGGEDGGVSLVEAMDFMMKRGVIPIRLMPYKENDVTSQPLSEFSTLASGFKALGYRRIPEKDQNLVKSYLAAGEPVLLVVAMHKNFLARGMRKSGGFYRKAEGESLGFHSLVAVGYDDAKGAFKLLNSWGKKWGDNGFGWLDYKFYPEATARAYVIYDTPTPRRIASLIEMPPDTIAAALKGETAAPVTVAEEFKPDSDTIVAGSSAEKFDDGIVLIPDEAGIEFQGRFLRLGDPYNEATSFFSSAHSGVFADYNFSGDDVAVTADFMFQDKIGVFTANRATRFNVATNRGVTFGTSQGDVARVYGTPDTQDTARKRDIYFFHPIESDWGGVKIIKHATLSFDYDEGGKVLRILLASAFKKQATGEGFTQSMGGDEKKDSSEGTKIASDRGGIEFAIPAGFEEVKKSDWGETGFGYFSKSRTSMFDTLFVKIFVSTGGAGMEAAKKRIEADVKDRPIPGFEMSEREFAGEKWVVASNGRLTRCVLAKNGFIYQIELSSEKEAFTQDWVLSFFGSMKIKK